jgi:hypothetical protein
MTMTCRTRPLLLSLLFLVLFAPLGPANAQFCSSADVPTFSISSLNAGNYDPNATPTPLTATITATATRTCSLRASFIRTSLPAIMTLSGNTLQYTIQAVGGGATYLATTSPPPTANWVDMDVSGGGGTITRQVQLLVPAGQAAPIGIYTDTAVTMHLYSRTSAGLWTSIHTVTVTPQATVVGACVLNAPSPATLTFSGTDIPNGVPNAAIVKSTTLAANCTLPTKVRLTGSSLVQSPPATAAAGFDTTLNYRAVASFGAATATLTTTTTSPTIVDSASKNVVSGSMAGNVTVDVNLIAGQPLIAGTYTGVLVITLDPSL